MLPEVAAKQWRLFTPRMAQYTEGEGPLPDALMDEVQQLRVECNARFAALLEATQARRSQQ